MEGVGVKGHQKVVPVDQDLEAVKERYLSEGLEEGWREMKLNWRELPQIYLKLSKSRLTGRVHLVYVYFSVYLICESCSQL